MDVRMSQHLACRIDVAPGCQCHGGEVSLLTYFEQSILPLLIGESTCYSGSASIHFVVNKCSRIVLNRRSPAEPQVAG